MPLTIKQEEGLKIAIERYKNKERYTVISGFAGSGKSYLVRFIISALGVPESDVCYACYTGKAAQVLLKRGNQNVTTLHKLLYTSFPNPDGTFRRVPNITLPYKIVVVDECSMMPMELARLLFSHSDLYVICLGDPFQLPPINPVDDNHLLDHPHVFLDEIMRQAQDSEIIRLSMDIRAGKEIPLMKGQEVQVYEKKDLNIAMLKWADQVLCATNTTRINYNKAIRKSLNRLDDEPQDGDKVICLRNYWDILDNADNPLINGTIGYLNNSYPSFNLVPRYMGGQEFKTVCGNVITDSKTNFFDLTLDKKMIMTGEKCCDSKLEYKLCQNRKTMGLVPLEFTYGYVITTWKAQGSEWDKVLVLEENFPTDKFTHSRFLYTSCTRASNKLVIIKK